MPAETVWQIGVLDRSSAEFRQWIDPVTGVRLDYGDPATDLVFKVGHSSPARDWLAFQPGSANGGAGFRAHPCAIEFELKQEPLGLYRLTLDLLAYSARLPVLQIEVNGRSGWFYQHPRLNYDAGDPAVFFLPYYATAEVICDFPASYLRLGRNRIVLTALDDPPERDDTRPAGFPWPGSSGVHYDALRLDLLDKSASTPSAVTVIPTIFYSSNAAGLRERVDVFVSSASAPKRVVLRLADQVQTNALEAGRSFGEWRSEFLAPEFTGPTEARVTIDFGGATEEFVAPVTPARKWNLFVVPNVHLDVGYTDDAAKVSEVQSRILDGAMDLARAHPDFCFTPDGFWTVEEFWQGRTQAQRDRLLEAVRRGTVSLPVVYCSSFTGFASLENLIRLLYPSKRFSVSHNTPFDFALVTDVPNYSWSFASVLAASRVRNLVAASDAYRAPFLLYNRFHELSPQWWEGPDGGRVLTWYSRHYHQLSSLFGLPFNLASGRDALPRFMQAYDRVDYRSDAVILYGSQAENADLHPAQVTLVNEWNSRHAYPRLRFAGFPQALDYILSQTGTNLPVLRGDGGPYWEDGLGANARTTALARQNMYRILSAEKAATLAELTNERFATDGEMLGLAWRNLLLTDEHTWQADSSVREPLSQQSLRQGALKDSRAQEAQRQIDHVLVRGLAALADRIKAPAGSLVVFNPLSWVRSGFVEVDLARGMCIVDAAQGATMPAEVIGSGNAFDHVRFEATLLPAVGYKRYFVQPGRAPPTASTNRDETELENQFYRVKLAAKTGRISSIVDRELGRELVDDNAPWGFNEYVYVTGGDDPPNRLVQFSTVAPLPILEIHRTQPASRLVYIRRTELGAIARIESSGVNTPRIESEVFLPRHAKRIEFSNRIEKTYTLWKEAVYFAYPFAMAMPRFRWATQNGFVDPARDLLPGGGREWFCAHQWLEVSDDAMSIAWVPVDAPIFTLGDIARGTWPRDFGSRPARVFSYVMNNYTPEGYQAGQGGEHVFRYVLTSARKFDSASLHRFGMEALTPLEMDEIRGNDKALAGSEWLPSTEAAFVQIDRDNLSLITWKHSEFGEGTVLRFLETGGRSENVTLRFPRHRIQSAVRCSAVEEELATLPVGDQTVRFEVRPHEIVTLRVQLEPQIPGRAR
jgi:alpha-mannosidase